jgi:hypothetical protein
MTVQERKRSAIAVPGILMADDGQTAMLEAAGLNGVCTDRQLNVVRAFGNTTAYLNSVNITISPFFTGGAAEQQLLILLPRF